MPGQHAKVNCSICQKAMRSDSLKRHMKTHKDILNLTDSELQKELQLRHTMKCEMDEKRQRVAETARNLGVSIPDEVKDSKTDNKSHVRDQLLTLNQIYLQKVELGEEISRVLSEGEVHEECLTQEYKYALELYKQHEKRIDVKAVILRPWQRDAFKLLQQPPNDRTVVWIYDERGNIGKSWFQNYVEAYYGRSRIFRCDLRTKHKDVCHILKNRSLSTVDIFLFNDTRSIVTDTKVVYRILEDIKDGAATASKYDTKVVKFKTPNQVVVFSNTIPEKKNLSIDRWQIFRTSTDGLIEM